MEFQKNLEAVKESRQDDPPEFFVVEHAKRRINECLFEIMPPKTTLAEMEDLAVAIFKTIEDAWQ